MLNQSWSENLKESVHKRRAVSAPLSPQRLRGNPLRGNTDPSISFVTPPPTRRNGRVVDQRSNLHPNTKTTPSASGRRLLVEFERRKLGGEVVPASQSGDGSVASDDENEGGGLSSPGSSLRIGSGSRRRSESSLSPTVHLLDVRLQDPLDIVEQHVDVCTRISSQHRWEVATGSGGASLPSVSGGRTSTTIAMDTTWAYYAVKMPTTPRSTTTTTTTTSARRLLLQADGSSRTTTIPEKASPAAGRSEDARLTMRSASNVRSWDAHTAVHLRHLIQYRREWENNTTNTASTDASSPPVTASELFTLVDSVLSDWSESFLGRIKADYKRALGDVRGDQDDLNHQNAAHDASHVNIAHNKTMTDNNNDYGGRHRQGGVGGQDWGGGASARGDAIVAASTTLQEVLGDMWKGHHSHANNTHNNGIRRTHSSYGSSVRGGGGGGGNSNISSVGAIVSINGARRATTHHGGMEQLAAGLQGGDGMSGMNEGLTVKMPDLHNLPAYQVTTVIGATTRRLFSCLGEIFVSPTTSAMTPSISEDAPFYLPFLLRSGIESDMIPVSLGGMRVSRKDIVVVSYQGSLCHAPPPPQSPSSPPSTSNTPTSTATTLLGLPHTHISILEHWSQKHQEMAMLSVPSSSCNGGLSHPTTAHAVTGGGTTRRPIGRGMTSSSPVYQWVVDTVLSLLQKDAPPIVPSSQRGWYRPDCDDDNSKESSSPYHHPHLPPMSASKASRRQLLVTRYNGRQEARYAMLLNIANTISVLVDLHSLVSNAADQKKSSKDRHQGRGSYSTRHMDEDATSVALKLASLAGDTSKMPGSISDEQLVQRTFQNTRDRQKMPLHDFIDDTPQHYILQLQQAANGSGGDTSPYEYWRAVLFNWLDVKDPTTTPKYSGSFSSVREELPSTRNTSRCAPGRHEVTSVHEANDQSNTTTTTSSSGVGNNNNTTTGTIPSYRDFIGYYLNAIFLSLIHVAETDVNDWLFVTCAKADKRSSSIGAFDAMGMEEGDGGDDAERRKFLAAMEEDGLGSDGDESESDVDLDERLSVGSMGMNRSSISLASVGIRTGEEEESSTNHYHANTDTPINTVILATPQDPSSAVEASPYLPPISPHALLLANVSPRLQPFFFSQSSARSSSSSTRTSLTTKSVKWHIGKVMPAEDVWSHCISTLQSNGKPTTISTTSGSQASLLSPPTGGSGGRQDSTSSFGGGSGGSAGDAGQRWALSCMDAACVFLGETPSDRAANLRARRHAATSQVKESTYGDARNFLASVKAVLLQRQGLSGSGQSNQGRDGGGGGLSTNNPITSRTSSVDLMMSSSQDEDGMGQAGGDTRGGGWYRPEVCAISTLCASDANTCALKIAFSLGTTSTSSPSSFTSSQKPPSRSVFDFGLAATSPGGSCSQLFAKVRFIKSLQCHNRIATICAWLKLTCIPSFKYTQIVQAAAANQSNASATSAMGGDNEDSASGSRFAQFIHADASLYDVVVDQETGEVFVMSSKALNVLCSPHTTQRHNICTSVATCVQASLRSHLSAAIARRKQLANLNKSILIIQRFAATYKSVSVLNAAAAKTRLRLLTLLSLREDAKRRLEDALHSPTRYRTHRTAGGDGVGGDGEADAVRKEVALRIAQKNFLQKKAMQAQGGGGGGHHHRQHSPRSIASMFAEDDVIEIFSPKKSEGSPLGGGRLASPSSSPLVIELTPSASHLPQPTPHLQSADDSEDEDDDDMVMKALFGGGVGGTKAPTTSTTGVGQDTGESSAPPWGGVAERRISRSSPQDDDVLLHFRPPGSPPIPPTTARSQSTSTFNTGGLASKLFDTTRLLRQQRSHRHWEDLSGPPTRRRIDSMDSMDGVGSGGGGGGGDDSRSNGGDHNIVMTAALRSSCAHVVSLESNYRVLIESEEATAFEARFVQEMKTMFPGSTIQRREAAARIKIIQSRATELLMLFSMVFGADNCVIRKSIIAEEQAERKSRLTTGGDFMRLNALTTSETSARKEVLLSEAAAREVFSVPTETASTIQFLVWAQTEKAGESGGSSSGLRALGLESEAGPPQGRRGPGSAGAASRAGSMGGKSISQLTAATSMRRRKNDSDTKSIASFASTSLSSLYKNVFVTINNIHRDEAKARRELIGKVCMPYVQQWEAFNRRCIMGEWWHVLIGAHSDARRELLIKTESLVRRRLFFTSIMVSAEAAGRLAVRNDESMERELIQCVGYCKRRQVDLGQWSPSMTLLAQAELHDLLPTESSSILLGSSESAFSTLRKRSEATTQELLTGLRSERRNVMQMLRSVYEARSIARRSDIDMSSQHAESIMVEDDAALDDTPVYLSKEERNIATIFDDHRGGSGGSGRIIPPSPGSSSGPPLTPQQQHQHPTPPTTTVTKPPRAPAPERDNFIKPSDFLQRAFQQNQLAKEREDARHVEYGRPRAVVSSGGIYAGSVTRGGQSTNPASLGGTYTNPNDVRRYLSNATNPSAAAPSPRASSSSMLGTGSAVSRKPSSLGSIYATGGPKPRAGPLSMSGSTTGGGSEAGGGNGAWRR